MIGSVVFKLALSLTPGTTAEKMCLWASVGGSACFFSLSLGLPRRGVQAALLGYELCVGVYLNAMGMLRSKYIPQEVGFYLSVAGGWAMGVRKGGRPWHTSGVHSRRAPRGFRPPPLRP